MYGASARDICGRTPPLASTRISSTSDAAADGRVYDELKTPYEGHERRKKRWPRLCPLIAPENKDGNPKLFHIEKVVVEAEEEGEDEGVDRVEDIEEKEAIGAV